ncbi:Filament-like plant protein 7 [Mucuna pruriens]|uniref:Filament-like plant protein 7 n=1 Tax=Mucuna pruriens TaxID=157652 RepID=A0A371I3U4_MUCPR|nr:Filament-like plant protein 7 [Mucuna pruriens]
MDHKAWLWGKKATQKTLLAADKANLTSKENGEVQAPLTDKEKMEKDLKRLNDKLAFTLSECNAKDEQMKKHIKNFQEAVAGWEKAEAEILSMKQHLDESIQQQLVYEDRVAQLDGALKECMHQLRFVREEQEQRIHDAVMKASKEFEEARLVLEEQLSETSKGLAKSGVENSSLNKSIIAKEKLIEDLKRQLAHAEADHNALMIRLESIEKDNASLKYETQVLEKELAIRNDEREFNRRTADASHKQHLQSVKLIAKLESECQRLRLLVRKRLPSQASLSKMKNEVEMLEQDSLEMRRTNLSLMVESSLDSSPETTIRRVTALTEKLCVVEEENKTLKESLHRKSNEVQFSRVMLARTASKLMRLESEIESRGHVTLEQPRSNFALQDLSLSSMSDIGSDDKISCSDSWASALISELEHFKSVKQKESLSCRSVGPSDISLMDDFLEMEKLAVVSVEKAPEILRASLEENNEIDGFSETRPDEISSEVIGKEVIPVSDHFSEFSTSNRKSCCNDILKGDIPGWLLDVVKVILEQNCVSHKNLDDIREDIRLALSYLNNADQYGFDSSRGSGQFDGSKPLHFSQHTSWEPLNNSVVDPCGEVNDAEILSIKGTKQQSQRDLSKSIGKIIELIEGISMPAEDYDNSDSLYKRDGNIRTYKNQGMPTGYMVRVFQWKTSELSNVLQQFLHACYNLLNDKADHENFATELTTALDWIMNHCFSLQDVSSMRDAIKKQFDWDETQSENEAETGMFSDTDKLHHPREQLSSLSALTNSDCHDVPTKEMRYVDKEEFKNIKDKVISSESEKEALEGRLQSAINQLQESEKTIGSLRLELQTLKELNRILEDQIQNHACINANLDTQLTETELKEANHKVLALEVELENKNQYCEELETRCVELQLQFESMTKNWSDNDVNQKNEPQRTDWEITAASEKLAECQETILNLGKQLKALAAPKDASLFDNAIAAQHQTTTNTNTIPLKDMKAKSRTSLFDQILADDDTKAKVVSKASESSSSPTSIPGFKQPLEKILLLNGLKGQDDSPSVNSLAIVPAKKSGGRNFWKRLFGRKKSKRKTTFR